MASSRKETSAPGVIVPASTSRPPCHSTTTTAENATKPTTPNNVARIFARATATSTTPASSDE
jgi:hypothetical protein